MEAEVKDDQRTRPEGLKFHTDEIILSGPILRRNDGILVVPCVLMMETVTNGALKVFEEFSQDAHWWDGVPIVRGHPDWGPVNNETAKLGKVRNPVVDTANRRVTGEAHLHEDELTGKELKQIESGQPVSTSAGFWCNGKPLEKEQTCKKCGKKYNEIEIAPYFYDHLALVPNPACPTDINGEPGCGINVNNSQSTVQKTEESMTVEEKKENAQATTEPPAKTEAEVKNPQAMPEMKINAMEAAMATMATNMAALTAQVGQVIETNKNQATELKVLREAEQARTNAQKASEERAAKEGFALILNQATAMDSALLDTLYIEYLKNPALWIAKNAKLLDPDKASKGVQPVGSEFVPHGDSDDEFKGVMPSDEDVAKRIR